MEVLSQACLKMLNLGVESFHSWRKGLHVCQSLSCSLEVVVIVHAADCTSGRSRPQAHLKGAYARTRSAMCASVGVRALGTITSVPCCSIYPTFSMRPFFGA